MQLQRRLAAKRAGGVFVGGRAGTEHIAALWRSKRLSARDKGTMLSLACNAIWTRSRLAEAGYELDDCCCLCRAGRDTMFHRLYEREATKEQRGTLACPGLLQRALLAGGDSVLYTRGILQHPAEWWPRAACDETGAFEVWSEMAWKPVALEDLAGLGAFAGAVYEDGSCSTEVFRELRRAGWGVVAVDEAGRPRFRAFGAVVGLPQTPQAAEWTSFAAAVQLVSGPAALHQDCRAVVDCMKDAFSFIRGRRPYDGVVREVVALQSWKLVVGPCKITAHVNVSDG